MNEQILAEIKEKIKNLPHQPGVYLMKNSKSEIIYVGKAKSLKNRVSSYFRAIHNHEPKVYKMVMNVATFDYIVTLSEFEALLLECSLIKQHNPKYNILLKDDKGYSYLKISAEAYPRITEEKQKLDDGSIYIGPYNSAYVVKQTVDSANKAFLLPTCTRKFPAEIRKARPCLNFHIKQCMGVCNGGISQKEYGSIIKQAESYIRNGAANSLKELKTQMETAAENMEFEKAAMLRDRIKIIERMGEKQFVIESGSENQDVFAFVKTDKNTCCSVLKYRENRLVDKEDHLLGETYELPQTRNEFLLSYYNYKNEIPSEISLDGDCEDLELTAQFLSHLKGSKVSILIPKRGTKVKLVEMARSNALQRLSHLKDYAAKEIEALDRLAEVLGLSSPPSYIEAYDISNFGDSVIVGGMVVFQNGKPLKSAYKRFNIKSVGIRNDYASMTEMIKRRFDRYFEQKESGEGFGKLPDLILLDGGAGHLGVIAPIIKDMGLNIPVYGMVKDSKHKTRAIASNGGEIAINAQRSAYTFVSMIQEEVHRYSINYSRSKHKSNSFASILTEVEGIGEKKAMEILKHFKTQKALKEADIKALAEVRGMNISLAEKLFTHLHS